MDFSTEQIVEIIMFLVNNKEELTKELKVEFDKNLNFLIDIPTGFYHKSFDTNLTEKMRKYLRQRFAEAFNLNTEQSMLISEEASVRQVMNNIIKESYE